jgi:hypothetical protein
VKTFVVIAVAAVCLLSGLQSAKAQGVGVNGKWHFVLTTPGGDRDVDVDLSVDADGKVTGKFATADVTGTYKDAQLDLNFPFTSDEAGVTADMKITGKLDEASTINGSWEFSSYNGGFKATRPAAAAEPVPASQPAAPAAPPQPPPAQSAPQS